MCSHAEVDSYMLNKYGMVDYHLNDKGYINLDEPGYDDKGNYIGYQMTFSGCNASATSFFILVFANNLIFVYSNFCYISKNEILL